MKLPPGRGAPGLGHKQPGKPAKCGADVSQLAFVALGSNLGNRRLNLLKAMDRLQAFSIEPLLRSSLWHSEPVDCPPGSPFFLNAVVGLRPTPSETPETLLSKLQTLEREFGRKPKRVKNESRPLDLDLISFGRQRRASKTLTLPHPRAHLRAFVLQPLNEIAPQLILPGRRKPVSELVAELPPEEHRSGR